MLNIPTSSYVVFSGAFVHMTSFNCETFVALFLATIFFVLWNFLPANVFLNYFLKN
jgi:hypothetical protein